MTHRRSFIRILPIVGCAGFFAASARSQQGTVDPQEPQAKALGYVKDGEKIDKAKAPKQYQPGQLCSNCALYQGKAGAAEGPCPLFGGRAVAAKGWCTAYAKKA
jgi:hypothetical protein